MAEKIFIDTSAWLAYYLSNDRNHLKIKKLLKGLIANKAIIYTSNDVIDETITRLIYTTHPRFVKKFVDLLKAGIKTGNLIELWVDELLQQEAFELAIKFSEHKLSLTDCTIIILVKRFNINLLVSLDSDFKKVGVNVLPI
ncbi:hypothetical protein A2164_02995 [Candidatus Curtissbacteria bacterium RBG_13_35_7]|uniref:PIN domain-containing protein n=1 Tax=Candidatus Curtissbacteria bacterium RBG_13_35_7 TaxID=1797705 RepID=A0A1F5G268_9BACT|nr:MAG: hypothetical protein A2164_02995 [Candidatus Curtissbacteria bacterium RBG_13_35_7]